ncbi:hypothetical protein BDU57DRAFT_135267 [Ampelomyces quisqualis]|uniref:Uncharacterized protein n=1 Tax=Ampelomyces quisqualis TaxID=50730 RepID=A0A6A5QWP8_AMPQU|nr:hypothetical protein BDU57DRAFT_135267 [Ampelomyces quisqualis]
MMALVNTRKRKDTAGQRGASRDKDKIRIVEHSGHELCGSSPRPLRPCSSGPAGRTFTNFRRGSIKIFSFFRGGKSPATRSTITVISSKKSDSNLVDNSSQEEAARNIINRTLRAPSVHNIPAILPHLTLHHQGSSLLQLTNAAIFDGESEPMLSPQQPRPLGLHVSRSTPGLSSHLTSKFSNAFFNNETVVHRPKLSSRPSIRTAHFEGTCTHLQADSSPKADMSDVPSLPSQLQSALGSSNGPLTQSTAPTSVVSSGAPLSAETTQRNRDSAHGPAGGSPEVEPAAERITSRWLVFPRQDAPRISEPSVASLENAAAAKVFFESHFNQLLGPGAPPRSMRRRNMERKLFAAALPNEQRQHQRRA